MKVEPLYAGKFRYMQIKLEREVTMELHSNILQLIDLLADAAGNNHLNDHHDSHMKSFYYLTFLLSGWTQG